MELYDNWREEKQSIYLYGIMAKHEHHALHKKLFLDLGMIHYDDYYGDEIRIGRLLNPHYKHENHNVFQKMCNHSLEGKNLSKRLWETWKNGRNLIFHYFPHNFKRLSFDQAVNEIDEIVASMGAAVISCDLEKHTQ